MRKILAVLPLLGTLALPLTGAKAAEPTLRSLWSVQLLRQPALDRQIAGAHDLGMRHARIAVRWGEVEKTLGQYDWRITDQRLQPVIAAGLAPLITLIGPNPVYDSPANGNPVAASSKDSVAAFARFAAAVVKRYQGPGFRYEIWNEPNLRTFWKPKPDGRLYAMLATAACQAMRAVQPDARIYVMGMNGTPVDKDYMGHYVTWSRDALQPEMIGCATGVSLHPYGRKLPESYLADLPRIQALIDPVTPKGGPRKDIIISEWGTPIAAKWHLTAEDQANRDVRILLIGALAGQFTNLFTMMSPGANPADSEQTFGLLNFQGERKPSYGIVQTLLKRVGDMPFKPICAPCDGGIYGLRFQGKGQSVAYLLWTSSDKASMALPEDLGGKASAIDLTSGQSTALPPGPLSLSEQPLLVEGGRS